MQCHLPHFAHHHSQTRMRIPPFQPHQYSTNEILGGRDVLHAKPQTASDWIPLVREGLSADTIEAIVTLTQLSQTEVAHALGIPERTLARRKREGFLSPEESSKVLRLARSIERSIAVFGHIDTALDWLKKPNAAMDGQTPLSLMDTDIGAGLVTDTLGRIEHGIFV